MSKIDHIIVALDQMNQDQAINFIQDNPDFRYFKIGMELFYRYGRSLIERASKQRDIEIFLDLKLHDIPKTVAKAIESLAGLPIRFLTVHASGGKEMLKQAKQAQTKYIPNCELLAVTYLTSLTESDCQELFASDLSPKRLAMVAESANIDGIVCSPVDLAQLRDLKLTKVCPGIRFIDDENEDQKRVMTPDLAFRSGADFLVIGRSLTQSKNLKSRISELSKL